MTTNIFRPTRNHFTVNDTEVRQRLSPDLLELYTLNLDLHNLCQAHAEYQYGTNLQAANKHLRDIKSFAQKIDLLLTNENVEIIPFVLFLRFSDFVPVETLKKGFSHKRDASAEIQQTTLARQERFAEIYTQLVQKLQAGRQRLEATYNFTPELQAKIKSICQ